MNSILFSKNDLGSFLLARFILKKKILKEG